MSSSSTANIPTQRISFVNKIHLILKATSDDETITPGYLYKEISDMSYESAGSSESLVEFLTDRLKSSSCHVKYKVLKLVKHLLETGSSEFKLRVLPHSAAIQQCTKFGGPPHPLHGNTPYLTVRKIATEVCEELYSMEHIGGRSAASRTEQEKPAELKYGGLGPVRSGGKIQGFGNTPTNQTKSLSETLRGGLEKLTETAGSRQATLLANLDMAGSTRNYQPPCLPPSVYPVASEGQVTQKTLARKPTPGKAGGGWGDEEDDDDDDEDEDNDDNPFDVRCSNKETNSKAECADRGEGLDGAAPDVQADWSQELELVSTAVASGSTGPSRELLAPSDLAQFTLQASNLCCPLVVELLGQKLVQPHHGIALRSLQLLEALLYSDEQLVPADQVASTCQKALVDCFLASQTNLATLRSKRDSSSFIDLDTGGGSEQTDENGHHWNVLLDHSSLEQTVYVKSAKLILTLQQLAAIPDMIPAGQFKEFFKPESGRKCAQN